MTLTGEMLIGQQAIKGTSEAIHGINPATNEQLLPAYSSGTKQNVVQACELAWEAFDTYRETDLKTRARFLEVIAEEIEAFGDALITRANEETGLPRARLEGERGRTCDQLRIFARTVRDGEWLDVRVDNALPDRQPLARPDLRQRHVALGPVVVFGASNFPLAFSVAGGDTASALAAGCPVIVKAHSAHPGTSELVGRAVQSAVKKCGLPQGVFSLIYGSGREVGISLVADHRVKAVGFTGSRSGGMALVTAASRRREPIPVYAEMSSINPVFVFPGKLADQPKALADAFIASLNMGAGQFCTNPGLLIALKSEALDDFTRYAAEAVKVSPSQTMLTPGIFSAYQKGVEIVGKESDARLVAAGSEGSSPNQCQTHLFTASAAEFLSNEALQAEMFGSASLIVQCNDLAEMKQVAEHLEGQLTATIHMLEDDADAVRHLLPTLERKAGRILANGWPTGVEVSDTTVHGGPFPATSDSRSTSVGTAAIFRFLRPVCYQNIADALLPAAVKHGNPLKLRRLVDGKRE